MNKSLLVRIKVLIEGVVAVCEIKAYIGDA